MASAPRCGVTIAAMPAATPAISGHRSQRCACSTLARAAQAATIENSVVNQLWLTCVQIPLRHHHPPRREKGGERRVLGCLPASEVGETGDPDDGQDRQRPCGPKRDSGYAEPCLGEEETAGRQKFKEISVESIPPEHAFSTVQQYTLIAHPNDVRMNGMHSTAAIRPTSSNHQRLLDDEPRTRWPRAFVEPADAWSAALSDNVDLTCACCVGAAFIWNNLIPCDD